MADTATGCCSDVVLSCLRDQTTRICFAQHPHNLLPLCVLCALSHVCVYVNNACSRSSGPNASVSDGIQSLSKANAKLERMLAKIGTKADTPEFRDRMHEEQIATTALVKSLMVLLKSMNQPSHPTYSSAVLQRLSTQFDREFRRFQSVNNQMDQKQVRVIDAVKNRRHSGAGGHYDEEDPLNSSSQTSYQEHSTSSSSSSSAAASAAPGQKQRGRLLPTVNGHNNNGGPAYHQTSQQDDTTSPTSTATGQQQYQDQALDIQFIDYDIDELEKRQREIGQIEQDVLEVSDMYKDLQLMVTEQQEHIDMIGDSITEAKEKTESAHKELLAAEEYQKKARRKQCGVACIVVTVIAVVLVIIFVVHH